MRDALAETTKHPKRLSEMLWPKPQSDYFLAQANCLNASSTGVSAM